MSLRGSMYSVSSVAPASSAVTNTDRVSSLLMKRPMERKLRKTYFKLEDACQKYQPIVHETEYWPRIDLDTPHGYCPFICSSEEHKERLQLYEDLQREQTRQNHHVKKTPKGAGTGCNAGEKVRIRRNITYCECCRMHISNLDEHLQSQEHQSYVTNEDNYREVKEMMNDLNKSADSLLQQYFLKQQKIKRKPAANTVNSVTHCSTYKENIPLQQNEERQSYSCTFVKQAETAECNEYKSSLASCSTFDTGHENSPSQIQQSESFGKASKLECSVGKENVVKDVNGKCTFSGRSTSENIEHGFMRSLAVVESTFATASVIYKCSDVEIEAEMRDEKQRRFSHVEKLRTKTCCNAQRNSYLSAEISQQKDLNCQKTKSVNCSCSALSSLQNSFYESRNCDSNILKEMKFAKQQKLRTPPFKKVCAKLFKSPAPYEFSLENFGIKLTPSPNIAYNKNPVQSIGQPVSDESYKYLEPSPEIIEQSLKLKVSERTAEIVSSSSIVQSDFAKAIKDAIFVDINSVSDKLKVVEIHDESAGTRRCANTVTPPRSKRAFADMVFVSSVDDACENYRKKSSPTVQVKRLRLEDIERTVVDDDVTFFTPRSSMKGAQFTHEHSSNSNKVGSSCEKRTNTAPGTDFNSKCTTPCLFTGVSSPVTILGRSFDCVDAEMEMVDEQSDEMPPSPVIGSKSRRDQSVASTATTGTGTIATGGYELIQIGDSVGESTHVEQQQQQLSSYVEGFYPLATETAAELEDEHRMEIVMDTRANAHLACTQDYIRKHKSTGRKKGGADCNNSEFVVRRTGRKRTARGESSCSQTDEEESTTTNGNATTIAERISTGASARCRSNTPKYLYRTPPREVHVVPTTPTPNLDSLLVPNSAQRSTSTLKETLKMKRVRKICRKLNSGAQNADVKHFELLIRKVLSSRL